ncbi:uncharacterized protein LOC126380536 [Pectinophora gossypiella]|uniref:uncharacterized protein LOC126380536 n=1 Tax=Pectinophora gossypiella TaxID=13191 RepID=UPI00214EA353|nr:uncharacterized protein LOC126380536 [Pectinophora gossypiella]XP_049885967.1 uncharacterized protein LOC126380536 [Pectinophora gossypiella]
MNKPKEKLFIIFIIVTLIVSVVYLYLNHLQENHKSALWSGERCSSELKSVKYQLNVVTDYKNRLDKLLTETQKTHEADKARFKDVMENCIAMKQQSSICQSQFEDLQSECKKVKEDYDKLIKESEKIKSPR